MDHNASSAQNINRNGLSAAEFQRSLYNWFENQGLLDELRTHLRQQMITALRVTSLRPSPSRHLKSRLSPKIQAINMLVAEFLLQQDHHYTLSVFTSEVPLLRSMPEFKKSRTQISAGTDTVGESIPHFHHQDVKDIMEILGLPLDTELGNGIYRQYQDNSENVALLTCILQNTLRALSNKSHSGGNMFPDLSGTGPIKGNENNVKSKDKEDSNKESNSAKQLAELYNAEMQEVLYQSRLKSQHIKQLQEEIRRFQDCEVERIRKEEEAKYRKELAGRESQIQADACRREEEITWKLKDAEDRLARQRQHLDDDLQVKEKQLSELATQLQEQRSQVALKLQQVEEHAEELKRRESTIEEMKKKEDVLLAQKNNQLDVREQKLHQEFERLNSERERLSYIQREVEENRLQLIEASQSLVQSQSQTSFLHDLQQQCAHLRFELDATRLKLDNLTEQQSQKASHSEISLHHKRSVKMMDKGVQTVLPLLADDVATAGPERVLAQDRALELEVTLSQQQLMDLLHRVQQENQELRGHTQQQRLRIDDLTSHAAQLANELEDARTDIIHLSKRLTPETGPLHSQIPILVPPGSGTGTVPPLIAPLPPPPPPLPPHSPHDTLRTVQSHQIGAGEELTYVQPPPTSQPITQFSPSSSQHSSLRHGREYRKKPPRRLMIHDNTTTSDETSPTDEILQEARRRLRKLEEESEAVDRSYRDFQLRYYESLGRTASVTSHPILQSTHVQQQNSNLCYGSFMPSRATHSSATGGVRNIKTPFIFRKPTYDDTPIFTQHVRTLFNPIFPRNASAFSSPLFRMERIPPFQYMSRSQSQFAFPQQLQTPGTVDNTATIISDRLTPKSQPCGIGSEITASSRYVLSTLMPQTDCRRTLQSEPSIRSDVQGRRVHQQKVKTDFTNSNIERRGSLSHTKLLDTCSSASVASQLHNPYQAKNVSFGNSLKTITTYNNPKVSSATENAANPNCSQKELNDIATRAVYCISVDNTEILQKTRKMGPITKPVSVTQGFSRSDGLGGDSLFRETDKVPTYIADSSTSSAQDDDSFPVQYQKNSSVRDSRDHNGKSNETSIVPEDILKARRKSFSYVSPSLGSELILKGTRSSGKISLEENKSMENTEVQLEKLLPVSDGSRSHISVLGASSSHETGSFLSSRTTLSSGNLSRETESQPVLSASVVSSTTIPSDNKDHSFEHESNSESSVPHNLGDEKILNKQMLSSNAGTVPVQEGDEPSEISESGTQMTVQNKEIETVKNTDTITSGNQDVRENEDKDNEIGKDVIHLAEHILDAESNDGGHSTLIVPGRMDESTINDQGKAHVVVEENQTKIEDELSRSVPEGSQLSCDFANQPEKLVKDQKLTSSPKTESIAEFSDQEISVGEQSKRDDSSKDDFW